MDDVDDFDQYLNDAEEKIARARQKKRADEEAAEAKKQIKMKADACSARLLLYQWS